MSEVSMRHTMKAHFAMKGAHWQRIEDTLSVGVPDINVCWEGIEFWIEAKFMEVDSLPKRESTPVRIGLSAEQCLWLRDRKIAGGRVLVVFKCGRDWFVFDNGFEILRDGTPMRGLIQMARARFTGKFLVEEVLQIAKANSA